MKHNKRKSVKEIKVAIIKALIDSLNNPLSLTNLGKKIGTSFPIVKKYSLELEDDKITHVIRVDGKDIVGVTLNHNSFFLIMDALKDSDLLKQEKCQNAQLNAEDKF